MEKINRFESTEGGTIVSGFLLGTLAVLDGLLIGSRIGAYLEHTGEHVKDIQVYNAQIATQLAKTVNPVKSLILNDDKQFRFETTATDGHQEMCSGEYAVKQAIAMVSGKITCQEVTTLSQ